MHEYLFLCCYPCYVGCRYKNRVAPCCTASIGNAKEEVIKMTKIKERGQNLNMEASTFQVQNGEFCSENFTLTD